MKKLILVLVALVGLVGSVSADTIQKSWSRYIQDPAGKAGTVLWEHTLTAEVTVKSMNETSTLEDAYCLVKDKYNHSVSLQVLRSGFLNEICERDYRLNKEKIHLIFLKNWKMDDDVMQATCIVWYDTNRKNWMYICLEEI